MKIFNKFALFFYYITKRFTQKGDISCDTFPQLAFATNSTIELRVVHCSLASLHCLPQRLAAADVRQLELYRTIDANLTTDLVRGMNLNTFQFVGEGVY